MAVSEEEIKEEKPKPKKTAVMYYCNEGFVYKGVPYQEHQQFDGSTWPKPDLEAALKTHLIRRLP